MAKLVRTDDGRIVYRVEAGERFTRYSEFAAWWTEYEAVEAGDYPVHYIGHHHQWYPGSVHQSWQTFGDYWKVDVPCVIVDAHNAPHFGGVRIGSDDKSKVGTHETYAVTWSGVYWDMALKRLDDAA